LAEKIHANGNSSTPVVLAWWRLDTEKSQPAGTGFFQRLVDCRLA